MRMILMPLKNRYVLTFFLFAAVIFKRSFTYAQPGANGKRVQQSGILFIEGSWNAALKRAAADHKYIFVDAYASWCGPCKLLKATTFRNKDAAVFFNENFINFSIDMEKQEGPALAAQWEIQAYPTLIIFDAAGKPVLGTVGFLKAKELVEFGRQALKKIR